LNWKSVISEQQEALLKDLTHLLAIPSVKDLSTQSETAPMGEQINKALLYMLKRAKTDGFRTKNIEGFIGFAEIGPADAEDYIAILCHLDVVPATGDWTSDPYTPTIREGKLFARGAIDDKGPTMAAYYAIKLIKESGLPLKHRIRILFGTDEESGMSCMKKYVQVEQPALTGFAPDAQFPIIHAEKGQINLVLKGTQQHISSESFNLCSFYSGEKGNMVPDYAVAIIQGKNLFLIEQLYTNFCMQNNLSFATHHESEGISLTMRGKSAHGMEPEKGINAATHLAKFLTTIIKENDFLNFISHYLYEDPTGEQLQISFSDSISGLLTVNPGVFRYSSQSGASISLNIRCPIQTPYFRTIERISEKAMLHHFNVDEIREKKPHHVDKNHPVIHILQQAYEVETEEKAYLLTSGGATYAQFIKNGVAYGAAFPGKPYTAHQVDEYIELDDLFKATAIYANAIYQLANM